MKDFSLEYEVNNDKWENREQIKRLMIEKIVNDQNIKGEYKAGSQVFRHLTHIRPDCYSIHVRVWEVENE